MSRRDTIIIAVLLNAGLLIVLFATSLKTDKAEEGPSAITVLASNQSEDLLPEAPKATPVVAPLIPDQVDQAIQNYVTPQVSAAAEHSPNFLADLEPMAAPALQPQPQINITEEKYKEVTVKKGDVLERIARQNQVTVTEIMKANKLTSTRLKIGQVLKIPSAVSTKTVSVPSASGTQYYTVKAGDNPWTIAVKHHMKVEELLKLNNMDEQKARRLKAGDKIRIN
ncbi:MAG: LysM peptidoglycan-binding domain-containing protein [Rhabdochlamydiaceae bacterium]|nr:LysM peptidoglycan-binding domain-containing protein [Rhabdochlamydiaceae bacterium]